MADEARAYSILGAYLDPVRDLLDDPCVSEICVNEAGCVWFERRGEQFMRDRVQPEYAADRLSRFANAVAAASGQSVGDHAPLLSAPLPGGARIQFACAPVVRGGSAFAIRCAPQERKLSKGDVAAMMAPESAAPAGVGELASLYASDRAGFLQAAVRRRLNILVSGGTSSGKTTLANWLLGQIDEGERVLTIEDVAELKPVQRNHLALIASRGGQNRAGVDAVKLLEAALRLRPDRILLGELRGVEAYPYIRAINSGHPGSVTTIHADTPDGALDQLAFLVLQGGLNLSFEQVRAYVARQIDVVVQMARDGGRRRISDVVWSKP